MAFQGSISIPLPPAMSIPSILQDSNISSQVTLQLLPSQVYHQKQNQPPPLPEKEKFNMRESSRTLAVAEKAMAQKIKKSLHWPGAPSKARVYPDINVVCPKEYWDYEALTIQWGEQDDDEVVRKVGRAGSTMRSSRVSTARIVRNTSSRF